MGYLYLLCVALMFSFGGTCVKLISPFFGPGFITFFRFAFGVFWLLLLKLVLRQPFRRDFRQTLLPVGGWVLFGAISKWLAYLTENYALSHGPSYGNIVTQPAQAVFLTFASILLFREKLPLRKAFCIVLCIGGVLCISWNGRSLDAFFHENLLLTLLFVLSGICAGSHVLSQKMIADRMDIIDSNLAIFAVSGVLAFGSLIPSITRGALTGLLSSSGSQGALTGLLSSSISQGALTGLRPDLPCVLAILAFGFITGMGFYLNAKAIPLVPFYMVPIIQSTMVIFAILWGMLFFHERITSWIICGTILFVVGLVGLQLAGKTKKD